jgi:hypothetical protein
MTGFKLNLNNGWGDCTFASDDAPKNQGLDSLGLGLVGLQKTWSLNL